MPTYQITAPNGKSYRIEGPDGASDAQVRAQVLKQYPEASGQAKPKARPTPKAEAPSTLSQLGSSALNTVAGIAQGAAAIPDAFINAYHGLSGLKEMALGRGTEKVQSALGFDRAAANTRKYTDMRLREHANPMTVGGLIEQFAPTPADATGKGVRVASQLTGGAMNIPGLTTIPAKMLPKAPAKPILNAMTGGREVAAAAERQGVKVLPADVGGPTTRRLTAMAAQTPLGAGTVVRAAQETVEGVQNAAGRAAAMSGRVVDPEDAGDIIQKGAKSYIKRTSATGGRLYKRAEDLAKGALVNPSQATKALDDNIADLAQTPETNAAALIVLQGLKSDLSKPLSVQAVRSLRTNIRARIMKEGLRGSDVERRVGQILDSAADDIAASLPKPAAAAYRAADAFWKKRVDQIDDILAPVIGKKGEKGSVATFNAIERIARTGDAKQLSRLMSSLPEEDAGAVTATIIDRLGAAAPGTQDAAGSVFSPSTFLTNWNKISPKAKGVLFGPELRSALDDLAVVTGGMKEASRYANTSQTGGVVGGLATGGAMAQFFAEPVSSTMFIAGQYGLGRLMSSPRYVRWLTRGARMTKGNASPAAVQKHVSGLRAIASQEPALQSEINKLVAAMNDNVGVRAAAGDAEENQ